MRHLTLSLALILAGCGVNEDNFADKFGHLLCSRTEECYEDDYYDDFDECLDDMVPFMEDIQDYSEALCSIDYDIASECYADIKSQSCEDFEEGQDPPSCSEYLVCD